MTFTGGDWLPCTVRLALPCNVRVLFGTLYAAVTRVVPALLPVAGPVLAPMEAMEAILIFALKI
ncbi:hypothetical protein A6M21_08235 [Desulfotomaculum copahuensis]|uniref:Uncharacterized protein n=1 Tax=Desulfotomaculum copahuensis TaxID=1838280 RepID=A0A1B7LFU7_9FIRM|nr:hypothetical protein A6M21_08235 [Desulfotomaculum copahuensis]